jgi:hypothetical protein
MTSAGAEYAAKDRQVLSVSIGALPRAFKIPKNLFPWGPTKRAKFLIAQFWEPTQELFVKVQFLKNLERKNDWRGRAVLIIVAAN